jgi:hypothetical protein
MPQLSYRIFDAGKSFTATGDVVGSLGICLLVQRAGENPCRDVVSAAGALDREAFVSAWKSHSVLSGMQLETGDGQTVLADDLL